MRKLKPEPKPEPGTLARFERALMKALRTPPTPTRKAAVKNSQTSRRRHKR